MHNLFICFGAVNVFINPKLDDGEFSAHLRGKIVFG